MVNNRRTITAFAALTIVGAAIGASYAIARRRRPHIIAVPDATDTFTHPVLIINPGSGGGKAQRIGLAATARGLGIETVVRQPGEKIAALAESAVDDGCDHLIIAGGDGSLARVAKVAIERNVAFSCVPSGTRNHFAMDLGLDRDDPTKALDAAFGGVEMNVDVGRIGKKVFLNNVSFGIYANAIAEQGYREHKAASLMEATGEDIGNIRPLLSVSDAEGVPHDGIEVLLASNNPYRFNGAPDFAGRARLDTGTLGMVLADRTDLGDTAFKHSKVTRWTSPTVTVNSTKKKVHVGIDGSLHKVKTPVHIRIDRGALRVVLATGLVREEIEESTDVDRVALAHLSGAPTHPDDMG
jgi:diacylglycerol kinase family enzyme